ALQVPFALAAWLVARWLLAAPARGRSARPPLVPWFAVVLVPALASPALQVGGRATGARRPPPDLARPPAALRRPASTQEAPMHARTSALLAALLAGLALAATSGAARTTAPTPVTISILVQKGRPVGGVKRPTVRRNALVRLVVRTDVGREVHVHGYDLEKEVVRGRPT